VRDAVHPAYHRSEWIQATQAVSIQRAHQTHRQPFSIGLGGFPADRFGSGYDFILLVSLQFLKTPQKIKIFQKGVMIKPCQAAIIPTPVTLKLIMGRRPGIFSIHGGKDILQASMKG
jgi:hypothetical protein